MNKKSRLHIIGYDPGCSQGDFSCLVKGELKECGKIHITSIEYHK